MIKGLIENECAGQNSLVKLASHFTSSTEQKLTHVILNSFLNSIIFFYKKNYSKDAIRGLKVDSVQQQQQLTTESLVNEYLSLDQQQNRARTAPRTFHMETLFNELKHIDKAGGLPTGSSVTSNAQPDWSQDQIWNSVASVFQKQQPISMLDERSFKWSADYLSQNETNILDEA